MQLGAAGLDLLKQSEGFRSDSYLDIAGVPTIGYGHRILPGESFPHGVQREQAEAILARDILEAEDHLRRLVKVPLTQGQFDALVDFIFNLGAGRFAASTLLREINSGKLPGRRRAAIALGPGGRPRNCRPEGPPRSRVAALDRLCQPECQSKLGRRLNCLCWKSNWYDEIADKISNYITRATYRDL